MLAAIVLPASGRTFLLTELVVKDPHVYAVLPLFGCTDITNVIPLSPGNSFNEIIAEDLAGDEDGDGFLDLAPIIVFLDPQSITTGIGAAGGFEIDPNDPGGEAAFHFARCSWPPEGSACGQDLEVPVSYAEYTNGISGTCLAPFPGTTRPYDPPVVTPAGPCFVSDPFSMELRFGGLTVPLVDAQAAATYDAPFELVDGLIRGFLEEAVADSVVFDAGIPLVGGQPLSSVLPGGDGCCANHDDRDLGVDGATPGWWIYLNFRAMNVTLVSTSAEAGSAAPVEPRLECVPNPFVSTTRIEYRVTRAGFARVRVLDVAGRIVRDLGRSPAAPGANRVAWNGTGADGRAVAPGIYFVRLDGPDGSRTRRIVRLR